MFCQVHRVMFRVKNVDLDENDWFFDYLQTQQPTWLAGVVLGPWAKLSVAEMRTRTPSRARAMSAAAMARRENA